MKLIGGMIALAIALPSLASADARVEAYGNISNSQLRAIYKVLKAQADRKAPIGPCTIREVDADIPNHDVILINGVSVYTDGAQGEHGYGIFSFRKDERGMKSRRVEVSQDGALKQVKIIDERFTPAEQRAREDEECRRFPLSCIFPGHRPTDPNQKVWVHQDVSRIVWNDSGVVLLQNGDVMNDGTFKENDRCGQ